MNFISNLKYKQCKCGADVGFSAGCYCLFYLKKDGTLELEDIEVEEFELRCGDCKEKIEAK